VAAAGSELVWFVDDDVFAPHGWLGEIVAGVARFPDAWCFGGGVRLHLENAKLGACPRCEKTAAIWESDLDLGPAEHVTASNVCGANFGARKAALDASQGFEEHLPIYWEEHAWEDRLRRLGGQVVYLPQAWLHHRRTRDAMRFDRRLARAFRQGRGRAFYQLAQQRPVTLTIRCGGDIGPRR
jgi:GT2 family glycosyltransferase